MFGQIPGVTPFQKPQQQQMAVPMDGPPNPLPAEALESPQAAQRGQMMGMVQSMTKGALGGKLPPQTLAAVEESAFNALKDFGKGKLDRPTQMNKFPNQAGSGVFLR